MLHESNVSNTAQQIIQQKLRDIGKNNNVRILFAVESGSRAWGFPSINSDYDVRFVYARSKDEYLSVKQYRDVIETDITDEPSLGAPLDLNGWDIRKALQLAIKSNATLIEWLQSPIRYYADVNVMNDVLKLTQEISNLEIIKDHYYAIARNAWEQIEKDTEVKVKLYCYALRPALALQWISQCNDMPPMDMKSLCAGLIKNADFSQEISDLIVRKSTAQESDLISHYPLIDCFIKSILEQQKDRFKEKTVHEENILKADIFFRKIIGC
jgi:predicted nucleotidyltransferase